ncbi:MAG: hypothetical protein EP299_01775 [Acidobacteria bacterium]|nr:MAG: hypothetical protein EP299_01775 [Acidobacteriota bacterium]
MTRYHYVYPKQDRLRPHFRFGRYTVEAKDRNEAIGKVVAQVGAGVLDTNVIDNGDGTFTVRYADG